MENEENKTEAPISSKKKWLTWAGGLAFLFFLAKGLLWLALPALLIFFNR